MTRHKEKDDEAGGEGLGKLLTRKRLWRDSTGAIIADRRPEHEKKRKRPSMTSQDANSRVHGGMMESSTPPSNDPRAPISPPTSDPNDSERHGNMGHAPPPDEHWQIPIDDALLALDEPIMDSFDFLSNASWGNQPLQGQYGQGGLNGDLPFDDLFGPDTGKKCAYGSC
jgi:hypothetical protein